MTERIDHLEKGLWGEQRAERHLKKKKYKILDRRLRIGRRDEIDLIAQRRDTLVFVEVKTRASETFARPIASVTRAKKHALSRAAVRYIKRLKHKPPYIRFDVIEVVGEHDEARPIIRHIENAFTLSAHYRITW